LKLKCIGILWCSGSIKDKANELYNNLAMYGEEKIGWEDNEFEPNLYALFDIASDVVFKLEPIFTKKDHC
jgi:hypothetical protein